MFCITASSDLAHIGARLIGSNIIHLSLNATSHPLRGFSPQTQWREAGGQFERRHAPPTLIARIEALVLDDFERLCGEPPVADVPSMVDGFIEALRCEGVDHEFLAIYRAAIEQFIAWASNRRRAAA